MMAVEFADRIESGIGEYYALTLFALAGMMFTASANDFPLLFVSLELITVTFYILVSFLRNRTGSLEAGVKYLILGALSSGFLVYGIALVYGATGTMSFPKLSALLEAEHSLGHDQVFVLGLLFVLAGLGFKIAAVPFQIWAPDVYQGAPTPTTAFLAVGSKAAGIVLLMRLYFSTVSDVTGEWEKLFLALSAVTILYGSLCAIPQRNLKRLLGYSSIASAGYLLLGLSAMNLAGYSAILYYLAGYLFTVLAAFTVICVVARQTGAEDISTLAGLGRRSPLLAATLTLSMVSLAGVPPLAGFIGKFLVLKTVVEQGATNPAYYWLFGVGILGVVVSFWYYFGIIRAIYWSKETGEQTSIEVAPPVKVCLYLCVAGMLYLGLFPNGPLAMIGHALGK